MVGRAAILVANKSDLVRLIPYSMLSGRYMFLWQLVKDGSSNVVVWMSGWDVTEHLTVVIRTREVKTSVGKQLAVKYNVKYIETSPGETW